MNTTTKHDPLNLKDLLIKTGLVTASVLNEATQLGAVSGRLLGCVLLSLNEITTSALDAALFVTSMLRSGAVTDDEAIEFIRSERRGRTLASVGSNSIALLQDYRQNVTVGKLCVAAGLISEFECLVTLEKALVEKRKIGALLLEDGLISHRLLRIALILQNQARLGVLSAAMASLVLLKLYKNPSLTFLDAVRETNAFDSSDNERTALFLLRVASIVTIGDMNDATAEFSTFEMSPMKALIASGKLSQISFHNALTAVDAIEHRQITHVQAVAILRICARNQCTYAQAWQELSNSSQLKNVALKISSAWRYLISVFQKSGSDALC